MTPEPTPETIHLIWISGAGCDGCTMATLGARSPRLEHVLSGDVARLPAETPSLELIHPALALESGAAYRADLERAADGDLGPFFLVLEGSVMDEARALASGGSYSRMGMTNDGRPLTSVDWVDRLAPRAEGAIAIGSCATWGGIPAARPNPTGAMGMEEHLGSDFRSRAGLRIVNVPGCAPSGEAFLETVIYVLLHWMGLVPLELDDQGRPRWLYGSAAHPLPPRTEADPPVLVLARKIVSDVPDAVEEGDAVRIARALDVDPAEVAEALELLTRDATGCPVPRRGWMGGVGGCSRVGGSCIGCTDRGFADRHLARARPETAGPARTED